MKSVPWTRMKSSHAEPPLELEQQPTSVGVPPARSSARRRTIPVETAGRVSILPLRWVLLGGAGTVLGPLLGTGLMFYLIDLASALTDAYLAVVGAALVVLVLFARKGVLGAVRQKVAPWLP